MRTFSQSSCFMPAATKNHNHTIQSHQSARKQSSRIIPATVIPPNIAPLNFFIQHEGTGYFVRVYSEKGNPIEIFSKTPGISIPKRAWHKLLDLNRGRPLSLDIFVESPENTSSPKAQNERWSRFQTLTSEIANEDIDPFLVYRRIRTGPWHLEGNGHLSA